MTGLLYHVVQWFAYVLGSLMCEVHKSTAQRPAANDDAWLYNAV